VGALAGYFYGIDSTPTSTTTTISMPTRTITTTLTAPDAYDQVASTYANHLLLLSSKNTSALVSEYESNASVTWTGRVPGLMSFYNGSKTINLLFNTVLGKMTYFFCVKRNPDNQRRRKLLGRQLVVRLRRK
jgi:hypothetical protein